MISHNNNKSTLTLRRRSRTKLRKPKYLRLHVISAAPPPPMPTVNHHEKQLINLFPLHPENQQDKVLLDDQENNMANIFSSCDDVDGGAATLTGILSSGEEVEEVEDHRSPSSVNYADEEVELVRTAMRKNYNYKLRDNNCDDQDLRWVRLASSSSSTSTPSSYHHHHHHGHGHDVNYHDGDHGSSKLVLKLDYEKIMKSWVNKGPFCINNIYDDDKSNNPDIQTVPELRDQDDHFIPLNGLTHCGRETGGNEGPWIVPEMASIENNETGGGDEAMGSNAMIHRREASVQRYKEKRRNRLFAKTIRYEVRKLNAEKRPRIKGRFVKRN